MNAVTCQASGVRASTRPARVRRARSGRAPPASPAAGLGRPPGSADRRARPGPARCGSAAAAARPRPRSAPADAHMPSESRTAADPPAAWYTGTAISEATMAPGRQGHQVQPDQQPGPVRPPSLDQARQQHVHQRDGAAGDHRAGQQQTPRAPRRAAPGRPPAGPGPRRAPAPRRNARLSGAAIPENRPKHSTGMAASTAWPAADRCRAPCSSGKSGGRLVIAARMLTARTRIPAISRAPLRLRGPAAERTP